MSELFIISSQQQKGFFNTFSQYLPDSSFSYITLTLQLFSWIENKTFVQSKSDFNFTLNNIHIIF